MTLELDSKNFDELLKLCGAEATVDLATTFLDDAQRQVIAVAAAVVAGDADRLRYAAHQLKSSSATLGASALSVLCGQLESLGRAGNTNAAAERMQELQQRLRRVQLEMGARLRVLDGL